MRQANLKIFEEYRCQFILSCILLFFSSIIFLVNYSVYQYPGNTYFPPKIAYFSIQLFCIILAIRYTFKANCYINQIIHHVVALYLMMFVITIFTNAVQYTPFPPIDYYIVKIESLMNIHLSHYIQWTLNHPFIKQVFEFCYDSLAYQMCIIPVIIALKKGFSRVKTYICLMLISTFIGFIFYYFFPTTAPASIINGEFAPSQYATSLKFNEIHHYITPSTREGGMIAMPSFHFIWGWLCVYVAASSTVLLLILIPLNIGLASSCLMLGWHYVLDLVASIFTLILTYKIYHMAVHPNR